VFILPVLFFVIAFIKFDFFRAKAQQHHAPAAVTSTNAKSDSEMQKTALTKDGSLSHNVESKLGYAPAIVPPVANPDVFAATEIFDGPYRRAANIYFGDLLANDTPTNGVAVTTNVLQPPNGGVFPHPFDGHFRYASVPFFSGVDSFQYQIRNSSSQETAWGTVYVFVSVDGLNDAGASSCNSNVGRPVNVVGRPVNVTNGNMYLQQTDYNLPGIGPQINLTRTYNSISQSTSIFGRGWSHPYGQRLVIYDDRFVRLFKDDG
jgi:hypothetical protein